MVGKKLTSGVRAGGKAPRARKLHEVQQSFLAQLDHNRAITIPTRVGSSDNEHESKPSQSTVKSEPLQHPVSYIGTFPGKDNGVDGLKQELNTKRNKGNYGVSNKAFG